MSKNTYNRCPQCDKLKQSQSKLCWTCFQLGTTKVKGGWKSLALAVEYEGSNKLELFRRTHSLPIMERRAILLLYGVFGIRYSIRATARQLYTFGYTPRVYSASSILKIRDRALSKLRSAADKQREELTVRR